MAELRLRTALLVQSDAHSKERQQPSSQRNPQENVGDQAEVGQMNLFEEHLGADGVHPQGENSGPIAVIVAQGKVTADVSPHAKRQEQGNPPGCGSPEEQSHALKERL